MSMPDELDLEKLFLPAWAQEPASANLYAQYEGEDKPDRRGEGRRDRPRRPQGAPFDRNRARGPRREGGPGGTDRDRRPDRGPQRDRPPGRQQQGEGRLEGQGRPGRRDRPGRGGERRPPPAPLPEIGVNLVPDEKGVDSLARQIKMTGRAYPLFDIAQMILQRPERVSVVFGVRKSAEAKAIQPLFVCALDDTLWLSEDEAIAHVLKKHFATFYQTERTATEPPKGKYTFVAQCGMSGMILGPPNYHDYQNQLRKLHAERFARMPFEAYKSRVKIVRDEEVVKKWIDEQSWKTEYTCLNMPEPLKLPNMEAVEKHFRETHKENIIKSVEIHTMSGTAARSMPCGELGRLVRSVWEDQRRFPLQIATALSQQFAARGLQFFKVNRTITHVSVARPHYLDLEATPVSEGVKRIVDFINSNPKSTRRQLVDALAPAPAPQPIPVAPAEGGAVTPPHVEATPEQTAVISDLHWLVHQGHVIEFANGILETAKKPAPKPPKPAAPVQAPAGAEPTPASAADTGVVEPTAVSTDLSSTPASSEGHTAGAPDLPTSEFSTEAQHNPAQTGEPPAAGNTAEHASARREEHAPSQPAGSTPAPTEPPVVPVESPS